jgi:hypothetical protein
MDKRQFRKYTETCRRLGFRFDRGQAAGEATAISSGINLHQTPHRPRRLDTLHGQAGGGGSRVSVQAQKRGAFPSHARRRLGVVEVVRGAAGPGEAESVNRARPVDNPTPQSRQLRRMAFFSTFSPSFLFARRRRMASRFYPMPDEMNVKRSFKPTAEKTINQRKT